MDSRIKIGFRFENSDGESEIETMWVKESVDGYVIDNIPFYATELALGDIVAAMPEVDGLLVFTKLVRPSRHSTVRLLFQDVKNVAPIREQLRKMGCHSELSDLPILVAVDIPPEIDFQVVKSFFDSGEKSGIFEYEEACLGFL